MFSRKLIYEFYYDTYYNVLLFQIILPVHICCFSLRTYIYVHGLEPFTQDEDKCANELQPEWNTTRY